MEQAPHKFMKNCPVCGKGTTEKARPFCSTRCADIDLGSWLGERYRVPTSESPENPQKMQDEGE